MTQAFHIGISMGLMFLGTGVILGISEIIGVIFIVIGAIWMLLSFIPNPLRKRFWIDDKTVVLVGDIRLGSSQTDGFPKLGNRIIRAGIRINSTHERKIDYIKLKLYTKLIDPYESHGYSLYFDIPRGIPDGKHKAQVRVYTNKGFSKSRSFQIDIPKLDDEQLLS